MIRLADKTDVPRVAEIYGKILEREAAGLCHTGWQAGVYPTLQTAAESQARGELFVLEAEGRAVAAARLNREQVPEYADCAWAHAAPDGEVMVLHTLVVDPACSGKGYATEFVAFYEAYARQNGCRYLRMDTNATNRAARALYGKLGYSEPGIVACTFNCIQGVRLVCLEKKLL